MPGLVVGGLGMGCIWGPAFQLATRDLRVELAGVASGTLSTLQEMGAVIASAAVGALLQNRLATSLHAQAVAAAAHLPAHVAASFVASFSGAAASGLQIGAGQSGAALRIPAGTPPSLAASLASLAHSVFADGVRRRDEAHHAAADRRARARRGGLPLRPRALPGRAR